MAPRMNLALVLMGERWTFYDPSERDVSDWADKGADMLDYVEIEVKATNAKGESSTVYGEYQTAAATPHEAAREILDHSIKQTSNEIMREIDPAR